MDGNASLPQETIRPALIVVMGVSGCGKSGVGMALAKALGAKFIEGDALHPAENVERMSRGEALTDELREGWLDAVAAAMKAAADRGEGVVAACSALKRIYRDRLRQGAGGVIFVHLALSIEAARQRVAGRRNHYMPASLVDSQFATLEVPSDDEVAITINAELPFAQVVEKARRFVRRASRSQPAE